jgi:hypothetical protein
MLGAIAIVAQVGLIGQCAGAADSKRVAIGPPFAARLSSFATPLGMPVALALCGVASRPSNYGF